MRSRWLGGKPQLHRVAIVVIREDLISLFLFARRPIVPSSESAKTFADRSACPNVDVGILPESVRFVVN
jgi:hypothetical protein